MRQMNCKDDVIVDTILFQLDNAKNWKVSQMFCLFDPFLMKHAFHNQTNIDDAAFRKTNTDKGFPSLVFVVVNFAHMNSK